MSRKKHKADYILSFINARGVERAINDDFPPLPSFPARHPRVYVAGARARRIIFRRQAPPFSLGAPFVVRWYAAAEECNNGDDDDFSLLYSSPPSPSPRSLFASVTPALIVAAHCRSLSSFRVRATSPTHYGRVIVSFSLRAE